MPSFRFPQGASEGFARDKTLEIITDFYRVPYPELTQVTYEKGPTKVWKWSTGQPDGEGVLLKETKAGIFLAEGTPGFVHFIEKQFQCQ
jgi:hypothetical protein